MKLSGWVSLGAVALAGSVMGCSSTTTGNSDPATEDGGDGQRDASILNPPNLDGGSTPADGGVDADAGAACLRVFVSSATYTGNLGGRKGGDTRCKTLADAAGLGAGSKWIAWLSSNQVDAISLLPPGRAWCLVDGTTLVSDHAGLTSGALKHAIDRFENGAPAKEPGVRQTATWTGTIENGKTAANNCDSWTKDGVATLGVRGNYSVPTGEWTRWPPAGALPAVACSNDNRLYCFEIE